MQILGLNVASLLGHVLFVIFEHLWSQGNDVLTLVVLDQMQGLKRRDNVLCFDRSHFRQVTNRQRSALGLENLNKLSSPIRAKRQISQIRQRLFRSTNLFFFFFFFFFVRTFSSFFFLFYLPFPLPCSTRTQIESTSFRSPFVDKEEE